VLRVFSFNFVNKQILKNLLHLYLYFLDVLDLYEMVACLRGELLKVVSSIMPTPATVLRLTRKVEGDGLKL
jgi:hypothetical protein